MSEFEITEVDEAQSALRQGGVTRLVTSPDADD